MGGALIKVGIGAFFVFASAQMGDLARGLLDRARESVKASELLTLDGQLAAWTIGQKRGRPPTDQAHFDRVCREILTAPGGRDVTKDRWGEGYVYERIAVRPVEWEISSKGPDRSLGSEDDLVVHRRDDHVEINRDPVSIIEGAIERVRRADERRLDALAKLSAGEKQPPLFEADQKVDLTPARKAALRQQLSELDRLLDS